MDGTRKQGTNSWDGALVTVAGLCTGLSGPVVTVLILSRQCVQEQQKAISMVQVALDFECISDSPGEGSCAKCRFPGPSLKDSQQGRSRWGRGLCVFTTSYPAGSVQGDEGDLEIPSPRGALVSVHCVHLPIVS